jgi:hypothetical protein
VQESRKSLLAGKKEEFEKIEQGEQQIADLKKHVADLEGKLAKATAQIDENHKRMVDIEAEKGTKRFYFFLLLSFFSSFLFFFFFFFFFFLLPSSFFLLPSSSSSSSSSSCGDFMSISFV